MEGQDKGERGPSMAVNGQGYKEPPFEGPREKEATPSMEWGQRTLNGEYGEGGKYPPSRGMGRGIGIPG